MRHTLLLILASLLAVIVINPLAGQDETIITVAVPEWMTDTFDTPLFENFRAQYPNVKVLAVPTDNNGFFGSPAFEPEEYLDNFEAYAATADVLYVSSRSLSPITTRAGYLLDIDPLVQGDPNLDQSDFIESALRSLQWDGGTWGLPVTAVVDIINYQVDAFDEAGLPYPSAEWSLNELINAGLTLTTYDAEGNVEIPGFVGFSPALLFASLTGDNFYDETQLPNPPDFSNPMLPELIQQWVTFQEQVRPQGALDFDAIPLSINQTWRLANNTGNNNNVEWAGALLPGGRAGVYVEGFAISAGTQNPELAYEVVNYLTRQPEVTMRLFGDSPARRSMIGIEAEDEFIFRPELDPEVQALVDSALENGIPSSELRFSEFLLRGISRFEVDEATLEEALEQAEEEASEVLALAEARANDTQVVVATPVPTPAIGEGQVVIEFGLNLFTSNIPRERWDRAIQDFVANNPDVGNIDLITNFTTPDSQDEVDCLYQPSNIVNSIEFDPSRFLNLDPFMDTDPDFNRDDFIGNLLEQVQRDNRTYAYPIVFYPAVLWYNPDIFQEAGIPEPQGGWTSEAFLDALDRIALNTQDREPPVIPFQPQTFGTSYLYMLIAALGGLPYDTSTEPPTLNLTDPTNVEAIRQVLDLAREGVIEYQELDQDSGVFGGGGAEAAIIAESFNTFSFRLSSRLGDVETFGPTYRLTTYPRGSTYTPVAYNVGIAYINADSLNAEACYQWIKAISQQPDLFSGVPARQSLIGTSGLGDDVTAVFQTLADQMNDPNRVSFAGDFGVVSGNYLGVFLESTWINRAFDAYVLEDAELEPTLEEAQANVEAFRECALSIPEVDVSQVTAPEEAQDYFRQFVDCAVAVSPDLRERYSFFYEG